ncbi:MAG: hypothetical protein AAGD11_07690 [Planctomycetota bacterium]
MANFLAYASVLWFFSAIVLAVGRNEPIVEAMKPIKNINGFVWQLILLAWVVILCSLQLFGSPNILGQRPIVWAMVAMTAYVWICLGNYYLRRN